MIEPRPYQARAIDYALAARDYDKRPIFCSPTGSGKTVMQALVAKAEMDAGRPVAILTPRLEIFKQTEKLLGDVVGWQNIGTLRSGEYWDRSKPVHVVSWDTLKTRLRRSEAWFPDAARIMVDEAHLSMAPKVLEILEHYEHKALIDGWTATPGRTTGKGLGRFYTEIKHVTTVRQLIKEGYLAPCEYWAGKYADVTGLKVRGGDYEKKKLSERAVKLVGDVVDNWLRLASDRHTIVFGVDIAHAEALCDRFRRVGVSAACIHNRTSPETRAVNVDKFKSGEIQVLTNVTIASYGFDVPSVNCVVCARPTRSLVLWLQMLGRGMRPKPDGDHCMVLDHANNTRSLGQADDLFRWRLDPGKDCVANWSRREESGEEKESHTHECEECGHLFSGSRVCPKCGWEVPFRKRDVSVEEADLVLISGQKAKPLPKGWPEHRVVFQMLKHFQQQKDYRFGWVLAKFEKLSDVVPPRAWNHMAAIPPSPRVLNWIHKEQQNYARRQSYAKRSAAKASG